jgi:2-alkenal reductase
MNRRFAITAAIGCGLLLLLVVVLIPALFFFSFRPRGNPVNTPPIAQQVPASQITLQAAVPTFTPAPANSTNPTLQVSQAGAAGASSDVLIALYKQMNPGVVSLVVNVQQAGQTGVAAGSGFIIDNQGHIVTNNHVVSGAQNVIVIFYDGTQIEANIVGTDVDSDLAVVQVKQMPDGAHPLTLGDSDKVQAGEWVVAIGNPFTLSNSMSFGIVSATGRTIPSGLTQYAIPEAIQTDAAINPGNSGGPLIDLAGEVIGVNAQIETGGTSRANSGVGFAIPINIVRRVAPALIENGTYAWPYLGITGTSVDLTIQQANNLDHQKGAYIVEVVPGSPADKAGLQGATGQDVVNGVTVPVGGDVVTAIDGQQINNLTDLLVAISKHQPGDQMKLTVLRNGQQKEITVTLGSRP